MYLDIICFETVLEYLCDFVKSSTSVERKVQEIDLSCGFFKSVEFEDEGLGVADGKRGIAHQSLVLE